MAGAHTSLVSSTHPKNLEREALAMELFYGLGLPLKEVSEKMGVPYQTLYSIISKYKPKTTGRDLVVIISSNFK